MAAPPEITLKDLSGDWVVNKTMSDDVDAIFALQGLSWLMRRALSWATITLHVKQYTGDNDDGGGATTHIDIKQTATGGIPGTTELRTLDWRERPHSDRVFGDLKGQSRWVDPDATAPEWAALDPFLVQDWLEGEGEGAGPAAERYVQSWAVNEAGGWTAEQIWGFAVVEGARYHVRRVVVAKGDEVLKARLVYNWQGKP